jgi:hypothetical protein
LFYETQQCADYRDKRGKRLLALKALFRLYSGSITKCLFRLSLGSMKALLLPTEASVSSLAAPAPAVAAALEDEC